MSLATSESRFCGPPHPSLQGRHPPTIPRPPLTQDGITNKVLTGVFSNAGPYYRDLTADWKAINANEVLLNLRKCAQHAVELNRNPTGNTFRLAPNVSFSLQSQHAIQQTYDIFLEELKSWQMNRTSYILISDMLLSTENLNDGDPDSRQERDHLWLFKWAVAKVEKLEKKKVRKTVQQFNQPAVAPTPAASPVPAPTSPFDAPGDNCPNNTMQADAPMPGPSAYGRRNARRTITISESTQFQLIHHEQYGTSTDFEL
ncbi:hypothetical protein ABW21_db0206029 [Orbilia brochopaga]|nr:hypothetical protein ABW21_db0206029 [Drechslerella brochopaga]